MTRAHRNINIAAVVLPFAAFLAAIPMLWNELVGWTDLALLAVLYFLTAAGITVGFHRLLTHRAFATYKGIEYLFAVLGSMAVEGPVIGWVTDHRRHHAHADEEGDPHSPHVGHGDGVLGALRGLWHAHLGWLVREHPTAEGAEKYAPDLLDDRGMRIISKLFPLLVALGLALPFALGWLITGELLGGLTALVWAGLIRVFMVHHVTFQLDLPLLRPAPLRDGRRVDERLLACHSLPGGVVAPQPPRLPPLGHARAALVGGRRRRPRHPRHAPPRPGVESGSHHARAPACPAGLRPLGRAADRSRLSRLTFPPESTQSSRLIRLRVPA
jgi:fatty-acid desaturase